MHGVVRVRDDELGADTAERDATELEARGDVRRGGQLLRRDDARGQAFCAKQVQAGLLAVAFGDAQQVGDCAAEFVDVPGPVVGLVTEARRGRMQRRQLVLPQGAAALRQPIDAAAGDLPVAARAEERVVQAAFDRVGEPFLRAGERHGRGQRDLRCGF